MRALYPHLAHGRVELLEDSVYTYECPTCGSVIEEVSQSLVDLLAQSHMFAHRSDGVVHDTVLRAEMRSRLATHLML